MMEFRQLYYFHVLAEELHFARAAQRLHIDPSSVSKAIKLLESQLGTELFHRSPCISLTKTGHIFLNETKTIFPIIKKAKENVRAAHNNIQQLNLAFSSHIDIDRLSELLRLYRQEMANIDIHLHYTSHQELLDGIATTQYDLGLSYFSDLNLSVYINNFSVEKIWDDPMVMLLPKRHPLLKFEKVPLAEICAYTFICFQPHCRLYKEIFTFLKNHNIVLKRFECAQTYDFLISLIAAGFGIGLMTKRMVKGMRNENIVIRPIQETYQINTYLISLSESIQSQKFRQIANNIDV